MIMVTLKTELNLGERVSKVVRVSHQDKEKSTYFDIKRQQRALPLIVRILLLHEQDLVYAGSLGPRP